MPKRASILVIDDDPLFRCLITSLLRRDYIVSAAAEGSEGFYQALEQPPDVAVIDIQMPNWDGLKTLRAFRGHPSLSHVKTVILTSDPSEETVLAAMRDGASDYVLKTSFSRDDFLQRLKRLLPESAAPLLAAETAHFSADATTHAQPTRNTVLVPIGDAAALLPGAPSDDEQARLQAILDDWE